MNEKPKKLKEKKTWKEGIARVYAIDTDLPGVGVGEEVHEEMHGP